MRKAKNVSEAKVLSEIEKFESFVKSKKAKEMPTIVIPDRSNGSKSIEQPKGCHCHCAIPIVNAWHESGLGKLGAILELPKHTHPGKGGWWKNEDCLICETNQ